MLKHIRKVKKDVNLNIKVSSEQRDKMIELADKYAGGNLSEWVRYAACQLKPLKQDLRD